MGYDRISITGSAVKEGIRLILFTASSFKEFRRGELHEMYKEGALKTHKGGTVKSLINQTAFVMRTSVHLIILSCNRLPPSGCGKHGVVRWC